MPVSGAKPTGGPTRDRNPRAHEWVEVANSAFDGVSPALPDGMHPLTLQWWETVRHMPHCCLWVDADWEFAVQSAFVADQFYRGNVKDYAVELRQREKVMGTTLDSRRDLRIRYVDVVASRPASKANVKRDPRLRAVPDAS